MNTLAFLSILVAVLAGVAAVASFWPTERSVRADAGLIGSVGLLVGLGATSLLFTGLSMGCPHPALVEVVLEGAALGFFGVRAWRRNADEPALVKEGSSLLRLVLGGLLLVALGVAALAAYRSWCAEPFGGWDGWAIWNMRARTLVRAGPEWPRMLQAGPMGWSHLDYPLLVPGAVARAWSMAQGESFAASGLLSALFGLSGLGILVFGVGANRSREAGYLAGLVLLSTPFYVMFSSNEHADIPYAAFLLGAVVLGLLSSGTSKRSFLAILAGVCAGFGAWTKNEGLLGAIVLAAVWGAWAWHHRRISPLMGFLVGLAALIVPLALFKVCLAPANELVGGTLSSRLPQLAQWPRHHTIWMALERDVLAFGQWEVVPFVPLVLLLVGRRRPGSAGVLAWVLAPAAIIGLGYYAIYLLTPMDLQWHLDTSLVRLLLQLWPTVVCGWALLLPEAMEGVFPGRASRRASYAGGAAIAVLGIAAGIGMERQTPADVLCTQGAFTVLADSGWHAPESDAHAVWIWSGGSAGLIVERSGGTSPRIAHVVFKARGFAPSTVSVVVNGAAFATWRLSEVWQKESIDVELAGASTGVDLVDETPATREGAGPEARSLGFALTEVSVAGP